jgi:hypothetical protein
MVPTGIWPMDLNFPVFATGVRIFRASNDVGPLFLGPGSTRIYSIRVDPGPRNKGPTSIRVDKGPWNKGPTSLLALKIRTPVANTGKLRSIDQVPVYWSSLWFNVYNLCWMVCLKTNRPWQDVFTITCKLWNAFCLRIRILSSSHQGISAAVLLYFKLLHCRWLKVWSI